MMDSTTLLFLKEGRFAEHVRAFAGSELSRSVHPEESIEKDYG
jgi:hypothetical protein